MEPVPKAHLLRPRITPEVGPGRFRLEQRVQNGAPEHKVRATLKDSDGVITSANRRFGFRFDAALGLRYSHRAPSFVGARRNPTLYDIDIELLDADGEVLDVATVLTPDFAAWRLMAARFESTAKWCFSALVLDQGYYPDGIMTAPTDEALIAKTSNFR